MKDFTYASKLSREETVKKISEFDIQEYGLCNNGLPERLQKALVKSRETGRCPGLIAALHNADTDQVLLEVLNKDPKKVMEGMEIAAYAIGAEEKILYLPEAAAAFAETLSETAAHYHIKIRIGTVNVRENEGNMLIHIVTAAELADIFADTYEPGVYVSVNGESVKKVSCDTKISELADVTDAKALLLGYRYHVPEDAELTAAEADIANGVVQVLTQKKCIVTETEKRLLAMRRQSCGRCVFCREGLIQLHYMQKEIADGRGKAEYLDLTEEIGKAMEISVLCTMGQAGAETALSAVQNFIGEYDAHIKKKNCPAGVCTSFLNIYIDPQSCNGCGECMDVCPKDCIEGKPGYIHMIDAFDCIRCGKCMEACETGAVLQTSGRLPKLPARLTKAGKFKRR